jgi:hypothetical protein
MSIFFKKIIQILLILIVPVVFQSNIAFGQTAPAFNQSNAININMSPSSPRAGDSIALELSSYSINIDSAKITWYVDGVAKKQGLGQKTLIIQAKNNGGSTIVRATAETDDGTISETSRTITPNNVDIIVEPASYIPNFYKGKPIFVKQGTMRIIAVPDIIIDGRRINSRNITFRWTKDDVVLSSNIGTGNDSIVVSGSVPIKDIAVGVQALSSSGNILAEASKTISAGDPKILFYEDSPLYGVLLNRAIVGNYSLGGKEELNVVAKPYFFNIESQNGNDIDYKWYVNGTLVILSGKKNALLLKQVNTSLKGTANVSLDVNNLARIFQFASANFSVNFGK